MANSITTLEALLDSSLAEPLQSFGFERVQRLIFQKNLPEVRQLLRFPTRIESGIMLFSANAAIRFDKIEELLGNADPLCPTLMMPVHLLKPGSEFCEWKFAPESSSGVLDLVLADCRQFLLPFVERMSALETLKLQLLYEIDHYATVARQRAQLSSETERTKFDVAIKNDGKLRLVLSPEQRVEKLAAIHVLEGRKDEAERLIDSEILKLKEGRQLPPMVAKRVRWEGLKKALLCKPS